MSFKALVLFILSLLVASGASAATPAMDVVFDLDWTLFYVSKEPLETHSIVINKESYRLADGVIEVLANLSAQGHRVSLFSGGSKERNRILADFILSQMEAQGVRGFSFYKILNYEHLSPRPEALPGARFADRLMKDLKPYFGDLAKVVLVDDIAKFSAPGQKHNLFSLEPTFTYHESYQPDVKTAFDPPSEAAWRTERSKILSFYSQFQAALEGSSAEEVLPRLQKLRAGASLCSRVFGS